jgi:lysophospholipase L1-like esterase
MKKEWLLLVATATTSVLIGLGVVRWFAPQLLGIPIDLQMVRVSEEVPPFFSGVFRPEDYASREFLIKDPFILRAKPLLPDHGVVGPHDILGFRNRNIPNKADIITIGDSQTYGNNAPLERNWPSSLATLLSSDQRVIHYSMAVGGWGAIEYLQMIQIAKLFQPRIVVVAFYTGNDPLESFRKAYSDSRWRSLLPDHTISVDDAPSVVFPPPDSELWDVQFSDGLEFSFAPKLRLASNQEHPAVQAGYDVMAIVAKQIVEIAATRNIRVVFTIIPTAELVYARKVRSENIVASSEYSALIAAETMRIERLAAELSKIPRATYVDIVSVLQSEALGSEPLYPPANGHPLPAGYQIIAEALAPTVSESLPKQQPPSSAANELPAGSSRTEEEG